MTLLIEDGSNVPDANSFVTLDEVKEYATARNRAIPEDDVELEALTIRAMDFIIANRARYQGTKTYSDQPLPFPRTGMYIDGTLIAPDVIVPEVKNLECQLVVDGAAGVDFLPTTQGGAVKRKVVGPLETEWFSADQSANYSSSAAVDSWLDPLLKQYGGGPLRVERV